MEAIEKDNLVLNTIEPNTEANNGIDEIQINEVSCVELTIMTISSIIFPLIFILFFIVIPYIKMIRIDKKKKILIRGDKSIINCCTCCFCSQRIYDLNEVKNVKIQVTSQNDPMKGFAKIYKISCYIYSNNDDCERLFSNIKYTKEKYDKYVTFFKKYITTTEANSEFEMIIFFILFTNL